MFLCTMLILPYFSYKTDKMKELAKQVCIWFASRDFYLLQFFCSANRAFKIAISASFSLKAASFSLKAASLSCT